ncbi:MAG: hypothetical protein ACYDEA_05595 [Candidatus Dormibacteria bacterium]
MPPRSRIDARRPPDGGEPPLNLAAEAGEHAADCPVCWDGNASACPVGLALSHALAASGADHTETAVDG